MVVIRRLTYFDYPKLKQLISYLCSDDDKLAKTLMEEPLGFANAILPLSLKFKPESFILIENNEILGLITVVTTLGNPYKIRLWRSGTKWGQNLISGTKWGQNCPRFLEHLFCKIRVFPVFIRL